KQGDIQACTWLCNRSIAANHPEQSITPLKTCWSNVKTGRLPVSTRDRALLEGDLALALMLALKIDEAAPLFQDVFVLDYQCVPAHLALALWLQDKQRDSAAVHELKVVTTLEPNNDLAWYLMSHLYVNHNQLDEGRAAAQKAIAINPKVASYWQELGDSYGY